MSRLRNLPKLALHSEVVRADGSRYRWDAGAHRPYNRPGDIGFASKLQEGFADGSCKLARLDPDMWSDVGLYDTVRYFGVDGAPAYEGRCAALPASASDNPGVEVRSAGWMTHAKDRPAGPLFYIDRSLDRFSDTSEARKYQHRSVGVNPLSGGKYINPDDTGSGAFVLVTPGQFTKPVGELVYHAPYGTLAQRLYVGEFSRVGLGDDGFLNAIAFTCADDQFTDVVGSSQQRSNAVWDVDFGDDANSVIGLHWSRSDGPSGTAGVNYGCAFADIAVYSDSGLTTRGDDPGGFFASDLITHSAGAYAPMLDTSGVQESAQIIRQAAEFDLVTAYDFWLKMNKYDMWALAVWDDRTLHYGPFADDASVTWRVRADEPGIRVKDVGRAVDADCNGVIVKYEDADTGRVTYIGPDDDDRLLNDDPNLDCNKWGIQAWRPVELSRLATREGAIRYAQYVLRDIGRQRTSGQILIEGHLQDDAGNWHPAWKVRAHDTILVEDREGPPRLIHEARWHNNSRRLTATVDGKTQSADAVMDQMLTAAARR